MESLGKGLKCKVITATYFKQRGVNAMVRARENGPTDAGLSASPGRAFLFYDFHRVQKVGGDGLLQSEGFLGRDAPVN